MAQVLFNSDSTPSQADLDANFTELYSKSAWATTGIGYATGSGGSVTQLTSKSTTVTLNKTNGQITTHAASLAGGASIAFVLSNSTVVSTDVVLCNRSSTSTGGDNAYSVKVDRVATGDVVFVLTNNTGGALAEAVVINFAVIKAVTA